jgi:6-phosphogluconate dehydrogenase (decarboxylating)
LKEVTLSEKSTPYYAKPKQPRLIWNNRDKRKVAEPLPAQTVEVIYPFFADKTQTSLELANDALPENRLIWVMVPHALLLI